MHGVFHALADIARYRLDTESPGLPALRGHRGLQGTYPAEPE